MALSYVSDTQKTDEISDLTSFSQSIGQCLITGMKRLKGNGTENGHRAKQCYELTAAAKARALT